MRKRLPENFTCGVGIPLLPPAGSAIGSLYVDTSTGHKHVYSGTTWETVSSGEQLSDGFVVFDPDMMVEYIDELGEI